jgi:Vitamin K-dependent gamma-carboxylase
MREWWRSLRVTYLTVDARSLGVFRVVFGLVLFSDLARRWGELGFWYANSGLLPNHTLLWRPPAERMFSLFFTVSSVHEAELGFAVCAVVYAMFVLGYRTGWAQLFTLVARVSLNSRLAVLENGGDMVMDLLCLLTLPLPLGARFSLDAVGTAQRESHADDAGGATDGVAKWTQRPVESLAVLGLLLQFAVIYLLNASSKSGAAWRDGTAVHYALHQDKLVTWAGVWMREHLPIPALHGLTWSVLATEWLGFWLIITPICVRQARLLAVCIMPLLHLGFALGLNVGGFSPAMISFYPLLLGAEHWESLSRRFGARVEPHAATFERALGRLPRWLLPPPLVAPSKLWRVLSDAGVFMLLLAIASEVVNDNAPVPPALRVPQPAWAKAVIEYPRILQGWRMFASEPPRTDSMIYVEATTSTGAQVDPYNEVASDQHYPAGDVVPTHMGQSQFFVMYSERISSAGYVAYRQAFSEWLLAYPERTHRAQDCLLHYDVYLVTDQSPAPAALPWPTPREHQRFMTYSAPFDSPCRSLGNGSPARPATSVAASR